MLYTIKDTLLYVEDLSAGYDDKIIIKDINLIEKDVIRENVNSTGQIIAVLGRSGSGKSTLFRVLTGLIKPISGKILIKNLSNSESNSAKTISEGDIGFVDQKYTLFRHKTIFQICEYAMRKSNMSKVEKHECINNCLNKWNLIEHKDKYSCELSGGQRQRVAIIEQILSDKHFFIMDEPFSGLDVGNINNVKESFIKIGSENEHNTIMFSTHDINLAVELADSIYIIGHNDKTVKYSTIIKHYDLKEMNIAWKEYGNEHILLVNEIKNILINS